MNELERIARLSPEKRALLIEKLKTRASVGNRTDIPRRSDLGSFPISYAQQQLWFLDQFEPDSGLYNVPAALLIQGPLDVAALEKSLNEVVRRHEVLRATFPVEDGKPVQHIAPELGLSLPVQDFSGWSLADAREQVMRLAAAEAKAPFDLSLGPLVRTQILRLAAEQHVLLFTIHHIVYDGWSTQVLVREVAALYDAFSQGQPMVLPPLPIQYADYAAWQREQLQEQAFEGQLAYWKERLSGHPLLLELPTDRPRPAVQTFHGAHYRFDLGNLLPQLLELGQSQDATLFMVLLAAFQTLLYRYTGQQDLIVGTPVANRSRVEVEGLIGFFVNTLPVRIDLNRDTSFRALCDAMRRDVLDAFAHQDVPLEMLVEALGLDRDLSHTPLVQVMFELHDNSLGGLRFGNAEAKLLDIESSVSKFDLTLMAEKDGERLVATFEYNTDLFDATTIERMGEHLQTLLQAVVDSPDRPVSALPLLTPAERQMLSAWNQTQAPFSEHQSLSQLFEAQVAYSPEALAVVFEDQMLTYGELNRRANQLAHYLKKRGVHLETLVGICVERSLEMLVGMLGILKAGGAYVPMDPAYPPDRLRFMVQDTGMQVLLTQSHVQDLVLTDMLPTGTIQPPEIVCLDTQWHTIARESRQNPASSVLPNHLAYVIYTSGSTGRPKGTLLEHRGVCNLAAQYSRDLAIHPGSRVLQFFSFSFDGSVIDIFPTLLSGATLCISRRDIITSMPDLHRLMQEQEVTHFMMPPSALAVLSADRLPALERVLSGGEACNRGLVQRWSPGRRFYNAYGPTETTVASSWYEVRELPETMASIPIGGPIANARYYLLDRQHEPVPVSVPGELYVGGVGVARGYLNRPGLTAEYFTPEPWTQGTAARLYKTGDLARFLPDGNVEYLGRIDTQVKVRGFRIELGEIEVALSEHPAIREVSVLAREDVPGHKRLVAYVVMERSGAVTTGELRDHLRGRLPEYMIPSALVTLDALPLTSNGKVDRRALPPPEQARPDLEAGYVAPQTPLEQYLVLKWEEILGVDGIGVHDNFFELGGNSIQAAVLVNRIRETLDVQVQVKTIFVAPTVAQLAALLTSSHPEAVRRLETTGGPSAYAIQPVPRDTVDLPLSFAQQRLWFLDQLEPDSSSYNVSFALRLIGALDVNALQVSFSEIVRRHEILRTRFKTIDGQAVQEIAPATSGTDLEIPLTIIDLSSEPACEQEARLQEILRQEARRPFNLAAGAPLRLVLLNLRPQEHAIAVTMHHIISDGWSVGVLIHEVGALYEAFLHRRPSPLPELPIQYADFAYWQRQWLQGEVLERQLDYWKQELAGSPPLLELPTDRPRPAVQSSRGALLPFRLSSKLLVELKALSRETDTTLFMLLLAAFQTLLYRYSGQTDICVGTPVAGRSRAELEGLIGLFVNTLVIRTQFAADTSAWHRQLSFRQVLAQVRAKALDAYAHQDLPFEMIVDAVQPERDLSRSPLFQVMFALQNVFTQSIRFAELTLAPIELDTGTSKFDLTLFVTEQEGQLACAFEYNADLFDAATMARWAGHLERLLEGAVTDPDCPVWCLPLLDTAERQAMLVDWNHTATTADLEMCIHHLVEQQARRTPDAVALVYEDPSAAAQTTALTYAELNARADQLAHYLTTLGVGPEVIVGVCMARVPEMVVGMLGILKAGGAYLPVDPAYPAERQAFMLQDARATVLLTMMHAITADMDAGPQRDEQVRVVYLDADWAQIVQEGRAEPCVRPAPRAICRDLAYVLFTSGSTGRPKGVAIEHRSAIALICWAQRTFDQAALRGVLASTSISFDLSVFELFLTLSSGGTVLLAENALQLAHLANADAVTLVNTVPSAIGELLRGDEIPETVQVVNLAGEPLRAEVVDRLYRRLPGTRVYDLYGPSEDTTYSTFALRQAGGPEVIGRPIDNTRCYVLDPYLEPVPVGIPGELYLGGAGLARGYLKRPLLTAERFLPDPFAGQPGGRLYKTGDLVRYRENGNIEFLGRSDHQVKLRGFRIELGEIESHLRSYPGLKEVALLVREDSPGERRLVAYLVVAAEEGEHAGKSRSPGVSELRAFLKSRVPEYMIPAAFVLLTAMPLTPNGKIDRRALPAPEKDRPVLEGEYVGPRTPMESILAQIWKQILRVDRIGVHDSFFELGGDSILSIQVIARANQAGLRLTPRQLFERPTIAELAAVAGETMAVQAEQGLVLGPVPLTPIQHWFIGLDVPQRQHWNQAILLAVQQNLDTALLEAAVRHLLRHHDVLRLSLRQTQNGWQQTILEPGTAVPFTLIDLQTVLNCEIHQRIEAICAETQASLDLVAGPVVRVVYMDLGVDRPGRLLVVVHHLAIDGVSWRILLDDLWQAYGQLQQKREVQLPLKTTSFQDWARRLGDYAASNALDGELEYWLETLNRANLSLPIDYPGGANTESSEDVVMVLLSYEQTQALLHEAPAAYGTEINDLLFTALAQTLTEWVHTGTIIVDLEGHGREGLFADVDLSRTVGWFTTLYPVRLTLENAYDLGHAIKSIKEQLRHVPQRGIGYGLLRYLRPVQALREPAQPQVILNYLGQFDALLGEGMPLQLAAESSEPSRCPDGQRSHLLSISGMVFNGVLRIQWSYSRNIHRRQTVETLAQVFLERLSALIAHCLSPDAAGYTPSDFSDVELDQDELDQIVSQLGEATHYG